MVITTKENTVEIRLTTRSMAVFEENLGSRIQFNFGNVRRQVLTLRYWQRPYSHFQKEVSSLDDAFDLIDECRTEGKTIYELYEELIQEANGGGFFKKKFTP